MILHSFFAWLFWDPSSVAFTIPYIERPVAWYGISFVTGFILAYFILQPIFRQYLFKAKRLLERDIFSWQKLVHDLNSKTESNKACSEVLQELSEKEQTEISRLKSDQDPPIPLKNKLLKAITNLMSKKDSSFDRKIAENEFPGAIAKVSDLSTYFTDRLTWFIVLGTIIGARLGHILFYDLHYYMSRPAEMIKIWQGGLASHGGTLGVIISILLFLYVYRKQLPGLSFVPLIDMLVVPTAIAATFIRIGNFINQEILGYPTTLPWAVIFGHPADGTFPEPRHPVSLYEALAYLGTFILLYTLWKLKGETLKTGFLSGLFFVLVFGSRFLIDFLKLPQSHLIDESVLQMGQILSIPFIIFGLFLMVAPANFLTKDLFFWHTACNHKT